jgi:hypothetical protein
VADGVVGLGREAGECSNRDSADLRNKMQHRTFTVERTLASFQAREHVGKHKENCDGNHLKGGEATLCGKLRDGEVGSRSA